MTAAKKDWLDNLIFYFFCIFLFSSTFSIALSQISLGLALIVFLTLSISRKKNFFEKELKYFYLAVGVYLLWNVIAALASGTPLKSLLMMKEEWLFLAASNRQANGAQHGPVRSVDAGSASTRRASAQTAPMLCAATTRLSGRGSWSGSA